MEKHSGPLYLDCTRGQAIVTWVGACLNLACVSWCAAWLLESGPVRPHWVILAGASLAGLFFADLFQGAIHWGTDTWFDEAMLKRVVSIAREHHIYPYHIVGYGLGDYVGYTSWPAVVFFGPICLVLTLVVRPSPPVYIAVMMCAQVSALMIFGTHFHRLGHARSDNRVVQLLQRARLLVTPQYHALHHWGNHDTHYCVVNGWANPICDAIGFWRGLEKVIHFLTGAVPRQNDGEWFARFREDRSFMTDPVPSLLKLRQGGVVEFELHKGLS